MRPGSWVSSRVPQQLTCSYLDVQPVRLLLKLRLSVGLSGAPLATGSRLLMLCLAEEWNYFCHEKQCPFMEKPV